MNSNLLIVDDEAGVCLLLKEWLTEAGFTCQTALDVSAATTTSTSSADNTSSADAASSTGANLSEPIYFYPDGTASTATLILFANIPGCLHKPDSNTMDLKNSG